jgi:hypothetical protein
MRSAYRSGGGCGAAGPGMSIKPTDRRSRCRPARGRPPRFIPSRRFGCAIASAYAGSEGRVGGPEHAGLLRAGSDSRTETCCSSLRLPTAITNWRPRRRAGSPRVPLEVERQPGCAGARDADHHAVVRGLLILVQHGVAVVGDPLEDGGLAAGRRRCGGPPPCTAGRRAAPARPVPDLGRRGQPEPAHSSSRSSRTAWPTRADSAAARAITSAARASRPVTGAGVPVRTASTKASSSAV